MPALPATNLPAVATPSAVNISVPDVTKFSTEITDTFKTLTDTLGGIKDTASAEAALPKLQDLGPKLDAAKTTMQKLGDAGKATIKALVQSSLSKVKELVEKVLALPGVSDKIKPVVDSIMAKLGELTESELARKPESRARSLRRSISRSPVRVAATVEPSLGVILRDLRRAVPMASIKASLTRRLLFCGATL